MGRLRLLAFGVAVLWPVLLASAASAAEMRGECRLLLTARDVDGQVVDEAEVPGPRGTVEAPLHVAWHGTVEYEFETELDLRDNRAELAVFGVPVMRSAEADPVQPEDTGSVSVGGDFPARFAGLAPVSGEVRGAGGSCSASGWIQVVGEPIGSVSWLLGMVLIVGGLLLLPLSLRERFDLEVRR
jgi:hypothetical protein